MIADSGNGFFRSAAPVSVIFVDSSRSRVRGRNEMLGLFVSALVTPLELQARLESP
jgi:hypothetical protein